MARLSLQHERHRAVPSLSQADVPDEDGVVVAACGDDEVYIVLLCVGVYSVEKEKEKE